MNIYDLISRAQKLRKETQLDSVSPDRVGGLHEDTLKYINEFQLLASSPSLHKAYASVSAMQSDKSPKSDLTGKPLKPGQLVVIVPANQTDATAGDVYRYDGPSGNTSAWTFVAKIGAVPADAELSTTSTNPPQNKVVTEKLTELESNVFLSEKQNILGTDTGSPGYSWGFKLVKPCTILRYKPDFVQPSDYTIDVYDVTGEIGKEDTTYNLIYSNSYKNNEIFEIHDINTNTIVIVTSPTNTIIKYSEVEPSIIANLIYRKDGHFGKVDNAYASGYFEVLYEKYPFKTEVDEKFVDIENQIYSFAKEIIIGTDIGTWGYSWGFVVDKNYEYIKYLPDFTEYISYSVDVYEVTGIVGSDDAIYNLKETRTFKSGEYCELYNIEQNTLIVATSSDGTLIKYAEERPKEIAFELAYRKDDTFNKISGLYASGYFETIQSNIENIENRIKIIEDNTDSLSSLYNKKIYLIGDSITEENNGRAEINWVGFLRERCGCIITNQGKSGTGFSTYPRQKYIDRIPSAATEVDIFGITISFNDLDMTLEGIDEPSQRREIGTYEDTTETTICGFINVFFDTLLERFPTIPVITYIQNPWAEGGSRPHHPAYRYGEALSDEFVTKVKETIQRRGVPVYDDLYTNGSVLKPWIEGNRNVYFIGPTGSVDTDHPGTEGHRVIYKYLRKRFEENIL